MTAPMPMAPSLRRAQKQQELTRRSHRILLVVVVALGEGTEATETLPFPLGGKMGRGGEKAVCGN